MEAFTVKTFGMLTERMNSDEVRLPYCRTTDDLKQQLFQLYPDLEGFSFSISVDKRIIHGNTPLTGREEIALLPPFSGG